ncbi:hypothetical protein [Candidatus Methylomicrobium oryzae]|jgi:hypothetical protein|uniref:hypothetical protein n=1 Tax=Candidatus Methylomicrobium oryzae TaxID=2802053 RepID=UPI001921DFAC|nr:hypothetical protein [Methylomicrobium sp. RS1]MBL1263089.1 hypothetical protein [Methylomicrobium sp. RS1]
MNQYSHNLIKASRLAHKELSRRNAIHEAGHAAAIYLGNKQKGLPPVYFRITINGIVQSGSQSKRLLGDPYDTYIAKMEGGRLVQNLPTSLAAATKDFSAAQKIAYETAFEADIINLLAGPVAEAKDVAMRDNELVNSDRINVKALQYYDGSYELDVVREYFECFFDNEDLKKRKINEFFLAAFAFVSDYSNWSAINRLADHILADDKLIIDCDEIISVLEDESRFPLTDSVLSSSMSLSGSF